MEPDSYRELVGHTESLVQSVMSSWDSSHDAFHAFRVRNLALSLASEEGLSPHQTQIVELAALLHDIDDHKYVSSEGHETAEQFLSCQNVPIDMIQCVMNIIHNMGFKEEVERLSNGQLAPEFGIVQDADRLDAIGAIGIARCFTFGGSRNRVLYNPDIPPRVNMTKEEYMKQGEKQTTLNHFHEKLLKLKDLMKTKAGKRRAEGRHKVMEGFLEEFYGEWEGKL